MGRYKFYIVLYCIVLYLLLTYCKHTVLEKIEKMNRESQPDRTTGLFHCPPTI